MEKAVSKSVPKIQLNIRENFDWKYALIAIFGIATLITGTLLMKQWNYAVLGKVVTNDVVKFLEYHGSTKSKGVIQGGMLNVPLPVGHAVTTIVARVLGVMNQVIEDEQAQQISRQKDEARAAQEVEKKKMKPQLCYDPPEGEKGKPAGAATSKINHKKPSKRARSSSPKPVGSSGGSPMKPINDPGKSENRVETRDTKEEPPKSNKPNRPPMLFESEDTRSSAHGNYPKDSELDLTYRPPHPVGPRPV